MVFGTVLKCWKCPLVETVKLNFLDFGNTDSIDCKNVREIPPEVKQRMFANGSALCIIRYCQSTTFWTMESRRIEFFQGSLLGEIVHS